MVGFVACLPVAVPIGLAIAFACGLVMAVGVAVAVVQAGAAGPTGHDLTVLAGESADTWPDAVLAGLERGFAGDHLLPDLLAPVGRVGTARNRRLGDRGHSDHRERCHSESRCGLEDKRGSNAAQ